MYLIQTVQTSWRPQLPLPKEIPAQLVQNSAAMETKSTKKETPPNKKWSFGRFFRKKKELDSDTSSDDDRKAGFVAQTQKPRKKEKRKRGSKLISPGFDHIVINPKNGETNELFLPFEAIDTTESIRSSGSADRRGRREKKNRTNKQHTQRSSSSDEDVRSHNSHNSSSLLRYRSDESLGSGGVVGSRRSRAARTERYYKRMSRDENLPVGVVTQQVGRWKTQPVQMGDYDYNRSSSHGYYLKNSNSLSNVPNAQQYLYAVPNKANKTNPVSSEKRSISFENHIHLQNPYDKGNGSIKSMPPPPPPRDPLRRVHVPGQTDLRPISYAFDKAAATTPLYKMNNRCVSDDKLWGPEGSIYQTNFHRPSSVQPAQQPRRFISRADRDVNQPPAQMNGVPGIDFKYIADAVPRSRKPIHILKAEAAKLEPSPNSAFTTPPPVIRTTKSGLPSPMKAASQFWRQIDQQEKQRREQVVDGSKPNVAEKPRSMSTSRAMPGSGHRSSSYENFRAFNGKINKSVDELDNVVSGNLYLKPTKDNEKSFMEVTTKPSDNKSKSMPNYYQQQRLSLQQDQQRQQPRTTQTSPLNKYEEYIARRAPQNVGTPVKVPPPPPQRKSMKISTEDLRKPTTNLEDAINELEAIYKSLKLGDEDLLDRAERRDIPTPTNFEKYAVVSDEDEEINMAEPDIVLDDVAYRNIKRANAMIKTIESQPPFGIPIGPVPPSPNTDYLHVTPDKDQKNSRRAPQNIPDLVTDDLAVRALRKDVPGMTKPTVAFTPGSSKKKRAARSMSANIYNLIQRDAAKPSGGNLYDYADVDRALEKAGSLTDVRKEVDDIPSTFQLLKSLRRQESEGNRKSSPIFRHPSHGGAVFNLPSTLNFSHQDSPHILQKPPIPMPRKSHSPEPMNNTKGMEEVLNRIAREAKESSEKLSKELKELRTEKLLSVEKPMKPEMSNLDKEIEEASKAAKVCEEILLSVLPKSEPLPAPKPRKLMKEDELVRKIEAASEAARYCEKLLNDVVAVEPPVTVETAQTVSQVVSEIQDFVSVKLDNNANSKQPVKVSDAVDPSPVEVDLIDFSDDTEPDKKAPLTVSRLLQNVNPFKSEEIAKLTERCMRQISDLQAEAAVQESKGNGKDEGDYDNLNSEPETSNIVTCKQEADDIPDYDNIHGDHIAVVSERNGSSEAMAPLATQDDDEEDIDKIMKECEEQVMNKTPYTSLSSSDCPKSSSPASSRHKSSSITSIHAFSSSDFVKSSSSDFHTPSTDPIKTFSTTSYDVNSSSPTPNITNSPVSTTPSPLLALTPISKDIVGEVDDGQSRSVYDSSEELAMIFGMTAPPSTVVAPIALPSENASTITSVATTATTGKELLALELINNANACVAIANNQNCCVATIPPATNSTTTFVSSIVIVASTSPTCDISTSTSPTNESVDCCFVANKSNPQQHNRPIEAEHDNDQCTSFVTIASFRTPETCRFIRLAPSPISSIMTSACLDTIPEMHDVEHSGEDNDGSDVDERFSVDNTNTFDSFNRFTNTSGTSMIDIFEKAEDEASKISVSSNPDSGNVSLSDFPINESQRQLQALSDWSVSASLELSLLHNSQLMCSNLYPYVNRVEIQTAGETCLGENNERVEADSAFELSETLEECKFEHQNDDIRVGENDCERKIALEVSPTCKNGDFPESELRNRSRHSHLDDSKASTSCGMSQQNLGGPCSSSRKQSKILAHVQTRQSFLHHIIIACTFGVTSHDFYTLVAIAFAMIVLIAILLI